MKTFKCLEAIEKEDVVNMEFENLAVLVTEVNKEMKTEEMRQFLLNILDVRDAEYREPEIIAFPKGIK